MSPLKKLSYLMGYSILTAAFLFTTAYLLGLVAAPWYVAALVISSPVIYLGFQRFILFPLLDFFSPRQPRRSASRSGSNTDSSSDSEPTPTPTPTPLNRQQDGLGDLLQLHDLMRRLQERRELRMREMLRPAPRQAPRDTRPLVNAVLAYNTTEALALIDLMNFNNLSPASLFELCSQVMRVNNTTVFRRLQEIPQVSRILSLNDNQLLRSALTEGHTEIARMLLNDLTVLHNAHAVNNQALRIACRQGYLDIVNTLLTQQNVLDNVTFNHNEPVRIAESAGRFDIVERLLQINGVAGYAYPAHFVPTFTRDAANPQVALPHVDRQLGPNILDLFGEFGRMGQGFVPQARNRVQPARPRRGGTLENLAGHGENAMRNIANPRANQALVTIQQRYSAEYNQRGQQGILQEIEAYLRTQYEQNPVMNDQTRLPITFRNNLNQAQKEQYYGHYIHTAYRWLFLRPNPWIDPGASFTDYISGVNGGRAASISEQDKMKICYMWLAAKDNSRTPPEGYTRESVKDNFIRILAEIGRAHNWDDFSTHRQPRVNPRTGQLEDEYDDKCGDKPSCSSGVSTRVLQFLVMFLDEAPETRPLNEDILKARFRADLIALGNPDSVFSHLSALSLERLREVREAIDDIYANDEGTPAQRALLDELKPSDAALEAFIAQCRTYFGDRIIQNGQQLQYQNNRYDSYAALSRHFRDNCIAEFSVQIVEKITQLTQALENSAANQQPQAPENNSTASRSRLTAK